MKQITVFITLLFWVGNLLAQQVLGINECIQIALENNSTLKQKKYSNQSADYDVESSYSSLMPSVDMSASARKTMQGPSTFTDFVPIGVDSATGAIKYEAIERTSDAAEFSNYSVNATASLTLFDGMRQWNQISLAKSNKISSDFDLLSVQNSVILDVQANYFNLLKQQKLYDVYEVAVRRSADQLKRTEKMFELGSKARLDVYQAKVNLGNDKINLLTQENVVRNARRTLNISMGRDPAESIEIKSEEMVDVSKLDVDQLFEVAMDNQPLLKKNEADIQSSDLGISLAKANYYPRISAWYQTGRSHSDLEKIYSDFDQNYWNAYGLSINWNLFNGRSDYINSQKAILEKKMAMEYDVNYKRELKARIKNYYDNYKSYEEIIAINEENLKAAKEELRLAEERYQIGAGTSLEVREAQVKLTRAEETLIAAQYNAMITLAQLDNELGLSEKKLNEH